MSGLPPGLVPTTAPNVPQPAAASSQTALHNAAPTAPGAPVSLQLQPAATATPAETLAHLRASIEHVSRTMHELLDVAAKTKLLSFNASIVAAQAGEHGRSFAVVAEQMKSLNERAHVSTRQMQQSVAQIAAASRLLEAQVAPPAEP